MSDDKIFNERKSDQQIMIGMVHNELEPSDEQSRAQIKRIIGRVYNSLPGRGEPSEPPIGRTNNSLPGRGEPTEPPIGRTNNELHDTK